MGEYFIIVNSDKRQYLSAATIGENNKRSGFLRGLHGRALALLACQSDEVRHGYGPLAGSWSGDQIIAAGDDNGQPDAYGVPTATAERPDRNLYQLAHEEYVDISLAAVAMLCRGDESVVENLVSQAEEGDEAVFLLIGNIVFTTECLELKRAIEARVGREWVSRYKRVAAKFGLRS